MSFIPTKRALYQQPMLSIKCCVDEHIKATYKGEIANPPDIVGLARPLAKRAMILFRHLRSFIIGVCAGVIFRAGWLILRRRNLTAKKKEIQDTHGFVDCITEDEPKMIREDITKEDFEQYVRDDCRFSEKR